MKKRIALLLAPLFFGLALNSASAWAYGSGGGGAASCAEAKFYDESPARNSVLPSVSEIALVASDNTEIPSLELQVNGKPMKPEMSQRRSGEWDLKVKLPEPITQAGKVRVTLTAKSKEGCTTFFPYYLEIKQ
ncbi:MAG: hypothetical protein NTX45_05195 [Proteobacteria bacterium]|nr:hypothetical protein [Pseudomonadota bacterium]